MHTFEPVSRILRWSEYGVYTMDVVVLDGNQRSALAVTRSLGMKGITVLVGAETKSSLASCSKYCSGSFSYPSPYIHSGNFLEVLQDVTTGDKSIMLLPMTDVTVSEVLDNREIFGDNVHIPLVNREIYHTASDKMAVFRLSQNLGIPMPKTVFSADFQDHECLVREARKLGYPMVLKPTRSRIKIRSNWINTGVRYAGDEEDLRNKLREEPFNSLPFVLQERIEGPGIGVFLLIHEGQILAEFSHRRIREKPPSGGVSVLSESIVRDQLAYSSAAMLLRELGWCGIAMVEFKRDDRDGLPKLMEINARFWGSLQLAITAGVDFPYLLYILMIGDQLKQQDHYQTGLRLRWELGDLDHLYLRLAKRSAELALPTDAPSKGDVLMSFIRDIFASSVRNEVFRVNDWHPFFFELREYVRNLYFGRWGKL